MIDEQRVRNLYSILAYDHERGMKGGHEGSLDWKPVFIYT